MGQRVVAVESAARHRHHLAALLACQNPNLFADGLTLFHGHFVAIRRLIVTLDSEIEDSFLLGMIAEIDRDRVLKHKCSRV
ncbi:MAG TPA: hypothetical protein VNY05_22535 [Candidatus Acidoferrales bacterium]|nr:hypothetical protein [Candidatus Acidoferrales bacterium]